MWLRRRAYDALIEDRDEKTFELAERTATITALQGQYDALRVQFQQANAQYTAAVQDLQRDVRAGLERLITAEANGRTATALIDLWRVQVNQLRLERDALLDRLVPNLNLPTPQLQPASVLEPAISFAHDPDAPPIGPDDPNHLTPLQPEDLGGLPGDVYTESPTGV